MTLPDTKIILNEVERLANGKLKFRDDLEKLIETAAANGREELLQKISFDAKFLTGLLSVIQKKDDKIDRNFFDTAISEYKDAVERIKSHISELVSFSSEFYKSIFNEKFLGMTQQCMQNLNFLFSDLSYLKLFFNDLKALDR